MERMLRLKEETGLTVSTQIMLKKRGFKIKRLRQFDILETMLDMQDKFQWRFGYNPPLKDIASAIVSEGDELWKAGGGKWWSKKKYSREEKAREIIDIIHFWLMACLKIELTAEEIFDIYSKKLAENYRRQFKKGGYKG